ncbi:hypothetical protein J6590_080918 [Homalodisca vitripennis]|nr:hypothetical protein J6590_099143 [Homalodisca vitripennis]KAG8280509.1 hypothetical protein J6590_080918 [Homalodisca vitripennis]
MLLMTNGVTQARAGYLDRAVDTSGEGEFWFRRFKDGDFDTEVHLKPIGTIQKQGKLVPNKLEPRYVKRGVFICEQLLQRLRRRGYCFA